MNRQLEILLTAVTEVVLKKNRDAEWASDTVLKASKASIEFGKISDAAKKKLSAQCKHVIEIS